MQDVVVTTSQLAVDLGCGPGYTTQLLAETSTSEGEITWGMRQIAYEQVEL